MIFYVGLDDIHFAGRFETAFISVNRLRNRRKQGEFKPRRWIMDSGAFTIVNKYGDFPDPPEQYAKEVDRWAHCGDLEVAVSQDYMCEPFVISRTGLSVRDHQARTVERFRRIRRATAVPVMPVLQGYDLAEYLAHVDQYGEDLTEGLRVGVGSVCKRNTSVAEVEDILTAIHERRPGLRLHGFGLKTTALESEVVWSVLFSADSMAWSQRLRKKIHESALRFVRERGFQQWEDAPEDLRNTARDIAKREIGDPHDWREAAKFVERIETQPRRTFSRQEQQGELLIGSPQKRQTKTTKMPRLAKPEIERRERAKVRTEKAFQSITENFAKLLRKHIANIAGGEGEARLEVNTEVLPDGTARMQMGYRMTVTDGATFALDDGQTDLPLGAGEPGPEPEPEASGKHSGTSA